MRESSPQRSGPFSRLLHRFISLTSPMYAKGQIPSYAPKLALKSIQAFAERTVAFVGSLLGLRASLSVGIWAQWPQLNTCTWHVSCSLPFL